MQHRRPLVVLASLGVFAVASAAVAAAQSAITGPQIRSVYPTPLPAPTPIVLRGVTIVNVPDFSRTAKSLGAAPLTSASMNSGEAATVVYGDPTDAARATAALYAERTQESRAWLASTVATTVRLRHGAP
jgi:hypothetical protein